MKREFKNWVKNRFFFQKIKVFKFDYWWFTFTCRSVLQLFNDVYAWCLKWISSKGSSFWKLTIHPNLTTQMKRRLRRASVFFNPIFSICKTKRRLRRTSVFFNSIFWICKTKRRLRRASVCIHYSIIFENFLKFNSS